MEIKLSKPCAFEGKEYTELILDFDSLTGRDMISAEAEARVIAGPAPVAELSKPFLAVMAAKAAKVPVDLIVGLPANDFSKVTMAAQDFLLG
ncbi:MAG TPA: phage tail assembly protein [Bacillota bacterium]|nr:phage tail assembly protein [Bacillota bacterium]